MRLFAWIHAIFHVFDVVNGSANVSWSNTTSQDQKLPSIDFSTHDCANNPYCHPSKVIGLYEWKNDCPGFPKVTESLWREHRAQDTAFLRKKLVDYQQLQMNPWRMGSDELTFPAFMAKRYAPNVPPSSMLCDGFGMCRAPSCKDIGEKLKPEEQRAAMLFFEFVSGLDHSFHITSQALQDHYRHILEDIDQLTRMFTYADEQQEAAIRKDEKKKKALAAMELAFSVITAIFGLFSTGANIMNFRPERLAAFINKFATAKKLASKWQRGLKWANNKKIPGFGKLKSRRTPKPTAENPNPEPYGLLMDKSIENSQKLWTITSGGWLGVQGLAQQVAKGINHKKDLKGFEKTLEAVRAQLVNLDTNAVDEARDGMAILSLGRKSRNGNDIIDLYAKDFFFGANVHFRAYVDFVVGMKSYATIISALWKTEGVYIVESWAPATSDCDKDDRGPAEIKVCLPERPDRSYWVYAMTNYHDKKTRKPPGWDYLASKEGFHSIFASDVVRAALWRDEVYGPNREKEDRDGNSTASSSSPSANQDRLQDAIAPEPVNLDGKGPSDTHPSGSNSTKPSFPGAVEYLEDCGNAPDGFDISVCRSWFGEAISSLDSTDNQNAPCQCDPINPRYAATWGQPTNWTMAATKKFIKESGLYNFDNFGKKCHDCDRMDTSWKALLQLDEEEKPAKHMKRAWFGDCDPNHHKHHPLGPPQLTHPNSTSSSSAPSASDPSFPPTPTREPIVQVTTQLVGEETRYPKNTPKNITRQGACNGPYCIVDVVYALTESHYNYTVDSSVRASEHGCYAGDDKCVEQSAHDLCDFLDDDEDEPVNENGDEDEYDREEVGPDDDEYEDFIQEKPAGNGTAPGDDKTASDNKAAGNGTAPATEKKEPDNEAMKTFKAWIKMTKKREPCMCGGDGVKGQHGIQCVPGPVVTRTTTIKGRMKQTATPLKPLSSMPTGSAGGAGAAPDDKEEVVTVTGPPGEATQAAINYFTVMVYDRRDASVEVSGIASHTAPPVWPPSSYDSFASYTTEVVS